MKKNIIVLLAFVLALILPSIGIQAADANPYTNSVYGGVRYNPDAKPPVVTILSPQIGFLYNSSTIIFNFNVTTTTPDLWIKRIYYKADWQENSTEIYCIPAYQDWVDNTAKYIFMEKTYDKYDEFPTVDFKNHTLQLTNVPDGNHTILLRATGAGKIPGVINWYEYFISGYSKVHFSVDTDAPEITLFSPHEKTYHSSEIPLELGVNETLNITYSLDGSSNITLAENSTLTGLSNGAHTLTVFARDSAGNTAITETTFNIDVPQPFPIQSTVTVSVIGIAVVCGVMLIFRKLRLKA